MEKWHYRNWYDNFGFIVGIEPFPQENENYILCYPCGSFSNNGCVGFTPEIGTAVEMFVVDDDGQWILRKASRILTDNKKIFLDIFLEKHIKHITKKELSLMIGYLNNNN